MKHRLFIMFVALVAIFTGCEDDYHYNANFTVPDSLSGVDSVVIDLESEENIVFTWSGGAAEDGSYVLYDVLFDSSSGDFSSPLYKIAADMAVQETLTLTHSNLNDIAIELGMAAGETGTFKWTVRASKGGVMKLSPSYAMISITRPEE